MSASHTKAMIRLIADQTSRRITYDAMVADLLVWVAICGEGSTCVACRKTPEWVGEDSE